MKIAIAFATTILSFTTLDAHATAAADVASVTVQYADLNVDRKAGIVTLYQRIQGAARRVCDVHEGRTLPAKRDHAACMDVAVSAAVARIDRLMLYQYVAQQSGKPVSGAPARVAVR